MRWFRVAFRQTRVEITYELLDVRELLVEIIESKKEHERIIKLPSWRCSAPVGLSLPLLLVEEESIVVVLFIFLNYLILNILKET